MPTLPYSTLPLTSTYLQVQTYYMRREGPGFALDGAGFGFVVAVEFVLLFELPPLLMLVEFVVLPFPLLPLPLPFVLHSFEASSGE